MTDRELIQQATALSLEIVEAFLADENDGGFDISAGCFGPNFTELICRLAKAEWNAELSKRLAQPEQEPFEYWNAVEGWVTIDEVREHFDSVGCGTIYKTAGEDRVPLYTAPQQRKPLTEQDACLIAAAPDLLEALQGLLRGIFDGPDEANAAMLVAKARDAVNKATGEEI